MDIAFPFHIALATALAGIPPAGAQPVLQQPSIASGPSPSAPPLPSAAQPLDGAMPWNWPEPGPNQISLQQFTFSDTQPQSCVGGAEFSTSASSFSDAYRAFLQIVDPKSFMPGSLLQQAIAAATPPATPPASGGLFPGWVAVPNSGGMLEYRPDYSISMTPHQWQSTFGQPLSVSGGSQNFLSRSPQAAELETKISEPEMAAAFVVRVPISTGSWYNDALVALAADGPFINGLTRDKVIGANGILRCRVTEIFVASGLSLSVTVPTEAVPLMAGHLNTPDAHMGPVPLKNLDAAATQPFPGGTRYTLNTIPNVPFIIGVTVQQIAH